MFAHSLRLLALVTFVTVSLSQLTLAEKPNIILVMCDDLGWGDVGFNGSKIIRTPHLDEMAKSSLKFNRFYSAAPVCSPTRGSAITGRHPFRYGIYFANTGHMKSQEITIAEALKGQGYATGHFGKWHLGTLTKTIKDANRGGPGGVKHFSPPQLNGFDVCFSTESKVPTWDPIKVPKNFPKGASRKNAWDSLKPGDASEHYGTHYWNQKGEQVTDNLEGDNSRVIMDRAIPFIESAAKKKQPFIAIVWFHTPHLPVVAGPKHRAMYAKYNVHQRNYYGCITAMDEQVGRLRAKLRELDIADNTMLTFCSDNGPEGSSKSPGSAGHFRGRKRSLYEGGVRVPGLIEWPGKIKPGVTEFPAVTSDYLPTVLDYVGPKPRGQVGPIDGISLRGLFEGTIKRRNAPIGFQSGNTLTLSGDQYKLVINGKGKNQSIELYDLIGDPREKNNIADDHADIVKSMTKELLAWQASCARSDAGGDY